MIKKKAPFVLLSIFLTFLVICFSRLSYAQTTMPSPEAIPQDLPIEHSVWVEDWTDNLDTDAFIAALPKGVNTIHVFVGQLALVDGIPTINGYTLDTPSYAAHLKQHARHLEAPAGSGAFPNIAALTDFVTRCKAQGATVKLSIGGQAGTGFGNSWSLLTAENINDFAQALVSLCTTTTADGIDFDEELEDTSIAELAGMLAGAFKDLAPNLITSYCVYAGCDASGPWHATNTIFLKNAVTAQNWCAIDRVYVMTYYDGCTLAQNETFMQSWITWLATQHGFTSSRISAGVDPNDPITSPYDGSLTTWVKFAAEHNLGTAIWDQAGVNDYVSHDWGTQVTTIYNSPSWWDKAWNIWKEWNPLAHGKSTAEVK